jgi:hypothetical protein
LTRAQLCPNCQSWFFPKATSSSCPFCGHEGSAPPAEGVAVVGSRSTQPPAEPFPWLELSPSLAFLLSVAIIGAGIALRSFALLAIGFAAIPCAIVAAGLLESLADRKALADMPEDDRVERERIKVADSVSRGFLPGAGPSPTTSALPILKPERPAASHPEPAPRRPARGPVVALVNAVASIFGAIGGGS